MKKSYEDPDMKEYSELHQLDSVSLVKIKFLPFRKCEKILQKRLTEGYKLDISINISPVLCKQLILIIIHWEPNVSLLC